MTTYRVLLAVSVTLAVLALLLVVRGQQAAPAVVADPVRTPGVLNEEVTQATIGSTICVHGWTRTIRPPTDYTNTLKAKQLREYGLAGPLSAYQEDHLISLELATSHRSAQSGPEPCPRAARRHDRERAQPGSRRFPCPSTKKESTSHRGVTEYRRSVGIAPSTHGGGRLGPDLARSTTGERRRASLALA